MPYIPDNGPVSLDPKMRIEEVLVEYLLAAGTLTGLSVVAASDRSALVQAPYCFVACMQAVPLLTFGHNYKAEAQIVLATNISDTTHASRKSWLEKINAALTRQQEPFETAATAKDAILIAWPIVGFTETSDGQETGDVIRLVVAARVGG